MTNKQAEVYQDFCDHLGNTYKLLDEIEPLFDSHQKLEFYNLQKEVLEVYEELETFLLQNW